MNKEMKEKNRYGIVYDYVEERLLSLKKDATNIVGEIENYEKIPLEYRVPMVQLSRRYENVNGFIDALSEIKTQVNDETKRLIDLLYLENEAFDKVAEITKIKIDKLQFRHKVLIDEVMEQMYLYTGPKRRYSKGKRRKEIPKGVQAEVRKRDKNSCTRCDSNESLHFHHKVRYAEGGQDTVDNLILLCVNCHAEEHKGERAYHILKKQAEGVVK